MSIDITLLEHQERALTSKKKKVMMLCGIGSGKSFAGACWTLKKYSQSPKSLGLITANTYQQLTNATLETCFKLYEQYEIPYRYNQQKHILTINNVKKFFCLSLTDFDIHRGIEVGEWWADELAYSKQEAYQVMLGRLRDKSGKLDTLFTTTPKGLNWLYDYFSPSGTLYNEKECDLIVAKTSDNTYLPEGYESGLRAEYGPTLSKQELDGEFVRLGSGLAYYAFCNDIIKENVLQPGQTVLVGIDFNVNPYCANLSHFTDKLRTFDEIYLENSNTPAMIQAIKEKVGTSRVQIIPDSTQFKRNTIGITDFEMFKSAGFEVMTTHNPFVIDRVNNVNRVIEKRLVEISPRCKKLINDMNKVSWKEKMLELDQTTDKFLTHSSDAYGYKVWKLMPFIKPTPIRIGSYI
jgi:phage terminase large subunit